MVDRVEIPSEPTGAAGPDDAKMIAVAEGMNKVQKETPLQEEPPKTYAGKYQSPEDLEKAYLELQKKLGAPREEPSPQQAEDEARSMLGEEDFDRYTAEYREKGSLSEESYKAIEATGVARSLVDAYIAGQQALSDRQVQEVYGSVGGEAAYLELVQWASENMEAEDIEVFNADVESGDLKKARFAVRSLAARRAAAGGPPTSRIEGKASPSSGETFTSMRQVVRAMSDPRYQDDPAYRAEVTQRLARSKELS